VLRLIRPWLFHAHEVYVLCRADCDVLVPVAPNDRAGALSQGTASRTNCRRLRDTEAEFRTAGESSARPFAGRAPEGSGCSKVGAGETEDQAHQVGVRFSCCQPGLAELVPTMRLG
jgi:hypothetical protein